MANANVRKRVSGFVVHIDLKHLLDKSGKRMLLYSVSDKVSNFQYPEKRNSILTSQNWQINCMVVYVAFDSIEFRYIWNSKLLVYPKNCVFCGWKWLCVIAIWCVVSGCETYTIARAYTHKLWVGQNEFLTRMFSQMKCRCGRRTRSVLFLSCVASKKRVACFNDGTELCCGSAK